MMSFDATGAVRWSVAGDYQPQIATADGGMIALDGSAASFYGYQVCVAYPAFDKRKPPQSVKGKLTRFDETFTLVSSNISVRLDSGPEQQIRWRPCG